MVERRTLERTHCHEPVSIDAVDEERFVQRELVRSESSSLVRAAGGERSELEVITRRRNNKDEQDVDSSKRLDGRQFLNNALALGQVRSTDCEEVDESQFEFSHAANSTRGTYQQGSC